jgi:hypothetical protein
VRIPDITGETFLSSLGFNVDRTTLDIVILVLLYGAFVALALGIFLLRLPRPAGKGRKAKAAAAAATAAAAA